ncbi:Ubiquitin-like modifier-activating enzyme 1-like 1, partial [Homarus americanus]
VAKNVILGGVKSVTLHDTKSVTQHDLSTQYYLCPSDLGTNRALASRSRLAELNDLVVVSASVSPLSQEYLASFNVVVLTGKDEGGVGGGGWGGVGEGGGGWDVRIYFRFCFCLSLCLSSSLPLSISLSLCRYQSVSLYLNVCLSV